MAITITRSREKRPYTRTGPELLYRCAYDGSDKTVVSKEVHAGSFAWDALEGKLYWGGNPSHSLRFSNIDGSDPRNVLTGKAFLGNQTFEYTMGLADVLQIHEKTRDLYWRNREGLVRRIALGGGGAIEEVLRESSEFGTIAIDSVNDVLYFSDAIEHKPRIRRVAIPPHPEAKELRSPPVIQSLEPLEAATGETIRISGKGFDDTKDAAVFCLGVGEFVEARFNVVSDDLLELVVPRVPRSAKDLAVLLSAPGGVAVTFPKNPQVIKERTDLAATVGLSKEGKDFSAFVMPIRFLAGAERAMVYLCPEATSDDNREGKSLMLVKNGGNLFARKLENSVVFHEPFAHIYDRERTPSSTRLVPVPAIRPSFVDSLLRVK